MELLAYSALLVPFPQMSSNTSSDTSIWSNRVLWRATLGSAAGFALIGSTLPAGAIVLQGSSCNAVTDIQEALTAKKYDVGGVDGIFGAKTHAAVLKFQTDQKLQADGIVGVNTAQALGLSGNAYASGALCEASTVTTGTNTATATPASNSAATSVASNQTKQEYIVIAEALNVRSGPSSSYDVVDLLFKDDQVEATPSQAGWLEIEKGKWISDRFVQLKSASNTTAAAPVSNSASSAPNSGSATVSNATADESQAVNYIDIQQLDPALVTGYVQVTVEALNVRAEPKGGTNDNVVGYLAKGEIVPILNKATPDGWIQVAWGDWISSAFVEPVAVN